MGTIIEINDNIVTVKFEDGSFRKYLKENFIREPFINQTVQLNNDGTLIDFNEKKHKTKKKNTIIIIIFMILNIFIIYKFVDSAIDVGYDTKNSIRSCG